MRELEPPFGLAFENTEIRISEHDLAGKRVFHIDFKGIKKPLVITVEVTSANKKVWMSVPQGRQIEAKKIGKLIANHIRNKRR